MILKINKILRCTALILGAIILICKLADRRCSSSNDSYEGFQAKEFDDIW